MIVVSIAFLYILSHGQSKNIIIIINNILTLSNFFNYFHYKYLYLLFICFYSRGPKIELYLAEEAIGLVKSLNWTVATGPKYDEDREFEKI